MRYLSTRSAGLPDGEDAAPVLDFEDAMLAGLARDGGLYVPGAIPRLDPPFSRFRGAAYETAVEAVVTPFLGETYPHRAALDRRIAAAYQTFAHPARAPLVQIGDDEWILELFRGPTLAFKDFAMQLIGQLFDETLAQRGERVTIIGATSGDTGSAAIEAFRGADQADVFILFPHNRVSEVQRRQMTTPTDPNVHALAIDGSFDDCQALVKAMFNDHGFRDRLRLAAVNSINWARVMAQTVYYVTAAASLGASSDQPASFSVPTGNFGDIYAGWIARRMGAPIWRLAIATNANDILHRLLETGRYQTGAVEATSAPSMDIQVSSNFERYLLHLCHGDGQAVRAKMASLKQSGGFDLDAHQMALLRGDFVSARAGEAEIRDTIARVHAETGYVLDPHTACGVHAARTTLTTRLGPVVSLACAHPAKFPDAVAAACGVRPELPPHLADLFDRPERLTVLPNDLTAIETHIEGNARK